MNDLIAIAVAVLAGLSAAVQSAINATLGKAIGTLGAAFLAFAGGTAVLGAGVLFSGRVDFTRLGTVSPLYWLGGLFGVVIVFGMIVAVPKVGLATATTALVVAQVVGAVAVDHFGLLGVDRLPATPSRLAGVALLIVALRLVFR